jgi:hypothetical protein
VADPGNEGLQDQSMVIKAYSGCNTREAAEEYQAWNGNFAACKLSVTAGWVCCRKYDYGKHI